ncbi:hypothetical protein FISHEDRAFT_36896 [Fistulina hepatica ATCC 64428]|uniref:T6SS Phospholipase effector Tle1-like catalytic domain-containing protein n=1 Tax=Fistulina hepatica ATCC 64428 TaxID=1128425 RepID=A0A0D7AIH5_9AGAR|nr:hypothetical protein FISHEDRAFT_36896 [Fistulina hepatica ATCC 64428]
MSVPEPRTLVLCFDGKLSYQRNSNVVMFFSTLVKSECSKQLCYYQPGVGTFFPPGVVSPFFTWAAKTLDMAIAWYLDQHVMDGYKFLMQNYCDGDRICLFGFSRGAYTARALAGCLYKMGLLPRDNFEQISFMYSLYKRSDDKGTALSAGFKQTYCRNVPIHFVGAWDTVASVGLVLPRTLPFINTNKGIKVFRHAISLDERRAMFRPDYYHRQTPHSNAPTIDPGHLAMPCKVKGDFFFTSVCFDISDWVSRTRKTFLRRIGCGESEQDQQPVCPRLSGYTAYTSEDDADTDVLEVFFAGGHTDVGGGAEPTGAKHSLAYIPLRWMIREVMASQCGILFDQMALAYFGFPLVEFPFLRADVVDMKRHGPPAERQRDIRLRFDVADALAPIHDELVTCRAWWLLEFVPAGFVLQDHDGNWTRTFGCGKGRPILDPHPVFHESVRYRMENSPDYNPKAQYVRGSEIYVQ